MSEHRALVARALAALRVHGSRTYSWFGARRGLDVERVAGWPEHELWRSLGLLVQQRLYVDFYAQGLPVPSVDRRLAPAHTGRADLYSALASANRSRDARQEGWTVTAVRTRTLVVRRAGITVTVPVDRFSPSGSAVEAGAIGALRLSADLPHRSSGHFVALGDQVPAPAVPQARIYWNLVGRQAPGVLGVLVAGLDREGIPFEFKTLVDSSAYHRCDAGVLYVERSDLDAALEECRRTSRLCPDAVKPRIPAFTALAAPGIGWAESPGDGESFGIHRCGLMAAAVVDCRREGAEDPLGYVEEHFSEAGIDLDAPHRAAASISAGAT